ncbi:MAG: response regulator [Cyanobacteria bacterium P01_A01_bin.45]
MNVETDTKHKIILLVEDNKAHVRLIQEALKDSSIPHQMLNVKDGIEAMSFLHHEGEYQKAPRPDLILLDLNLPKKDGREVLSEIKADPILKRIPVVVLTTSHNEDDISQSYDLHVNCYITKSRNLNELFQIVKGIEEFWLSLVTLPPEM